MSKPTADEEEAQPAKLDARLAAVVRLSPDVVKEMIALDRRAVNIRPITRFLDTQPVAVPAVRVAAPDLKAPPLHGVRVDERGVVTVAILINFQGDPARFTAAGARVRSVIGDIVTADASLDVVRALELDPEVRFIELAQPMFRLLDTSVPEIGVTRTSSADTPTGGAGTVIGVIDLGGIDVHHPDFVVAGPDGDRGRVVWLWDQTTTTEEVPVSVANHSPSPWGYGVERSGRDIDREREGGALYSTVVAFPRDTHATHVASIAAGNGRASVGRYTGVAPETEIIFVNLGRDPAERDPLGSSDTLVDALSYVFDRAAGKPCVVNVSLGTRLGPRDGTSLVERAIDHLAQRVGCAVVVAAGNDGESRRHKVGGLPSVGGIRLDFQVPGGTTRGEIVEIWYPGDERLDVTILDPLGRRCGPFGPSTENSFGIGRAEITVATVTGDARNGDNQIVAIFQPSEQNATIAPGLWGIELARSPGWSQPVGERRYYATIGGNTEVAWREPTRGSCSITSPATAEGAIAVANYLHAVDRFVSSTSSRGPTRDGRAKPDVAAPGGGIRAAIAASRPDERASFYERRSGTSMAAPHVAGLVALLFERDPVLDTRKIKERLRADADRSGLIGEWDPSYGWGRVRACRDGNRHRRSEPTFHALREDRKMKSTNQETNLARGALLPPQRSAASSGDQLQIDIGDYEIFVGDQKVGEVWVEPITEAPGDTVEHWCLLSNYVQPSEHSPVVSLQFRFASGLHASFDDFIRYVRAQSGARYIKATCCEQAP